MSFDEFQMKLNQIKFEYEKLTNKKLSTIDELELFLMQRISKTKSKGLKSLKSIPSFNR